MRRRDEKIVGYKWRRYKRGRAVPEEGGGEWREMVIDMKGK